jgi:hypothetical protein
VNRLTKQIAAVLALVAMVCFGAWPFWQYLYVRSASAALQAQVKRLAEQDAQLKAALAVAMLDDVLTPDEAKIIVEAGGEKVDAAE